MLAITMSCISDGYIFSMPRLTLHVIFTLLRRASKVCKTHLLSHTFPLYSVHFSKLADISGKLNTSIWLHTEVNKKRLDFNFSLHYRDISNA